jgi:tetratricopeptide (TPR) repeat protein
MPAPAQNPRAEAERLFREGRFGEAARAYDGVDERRRAIALLGEAFTRAFPENLPKGPYVIIQTLTGERYEGFGEMEGGRLKIVDGAGRSFAFPEAAISARQDISREEARDRIAREALNSTEVAGPRIFALIQAACTVGRPDAAAPLLEPALEADEKEPYFLSSVRGRVPTAWQREMYRAFATAQAPAVMAADEPVVRVPARLGGGRNVVTAPEGSAAKNPKVRALMEEAAPHRKRGEKLYKEIVLKGADASAKDLVDEAIREFDKALALYEKAVAIEESDALYSVMQSASRLRFHVAFWKQQLEGR